MKFLGVAEGGLHGLTRGKRYTPRHDCPECQVEILERVMDAGCRVVHNTRFGLFYVLGEVFQVKRRRQR